MKTLSPRQLQCLDLLCEGYTARDIALKLELSPRTVEYHLLNANNIFRARNITHLACEYLLKKTDNNQRIKTYNC